MNTALLELANCKESVVPAKVGTQGLDERSLKNVTRFPLSRE
jgi:hypothetical protein